MAIDESKKRKVIRAKCDTPDGRSARFFFGVVEGDFKSVEELTEDHARMASRRLDEKLTEFCTPLQGPVDHALKEHIQKRVRVLAADGAKSERRALFLAAGNMFKRVFLIIRDHAHALRLAIKDSLLCDESFNLVYEELFDKKKALIKNIQYSDKLKLMLQRIQQEIGEANANASRLKTVLKHFSWAKQRFDSTADPVAKVALMLVPIATLLAFVATDERHQSEDRNRATKLLKIMSKSEFCLTIGVFADWNIVLQAFLRL